MKKKGSHITTNILILTRASTLNTNFNQLKTLEKVNAYKSFNQISLIHICAANAYANVFEKLNKAQIQR